MNSNLVVTTSYYEEISYHDSAGKKKKTKQKTFLQSAIFRFFSSNLLGMMIYVRKKSSLIKFLDYLEKKKHFNLQFKNIILKS